MLKETKHLSCMDSHLKNNSNLLVHVTVRLKNMSAKLFYLSPNKISNVGINPLKKKLDTISCCFAIFSTLRNANFIKPYQSPVHS